MTYSLPAVDSRRQKERCQEGKDQEESWFEASAAAEEAGGGRGAEEACP